MLTTKKLDLKEQYTIWQNLGRSLLIGEGNLSFALSLGKQYRTKPIPIIATTFESEYEWDQDTFVNSILLKDRGVLVIDSVDGTKLSNFFPGEQFDTIIFQFPNVASRDPIDGKNPNHVLIKKFLKNAKSILKPYGFILITTIDSPYYDGCFQYEDAAQKSEFYHLTKIPFDPLEHPGYTHTNTHNDESALEKNDKFSTHVFIQ